jgi:hypothetical protein
MIDRDAAFVQEFFHMARTQGISHVPSNARQNDLLREMGPFEAHHALFPPLFTVDNRGRAYPKWRMNENLRQNPILSGDRDGEKDAPGYI